MPRVPDVSVVIPAHDAAATLHRTVQALAAPDADCFPEPAWLERGLGAMGQVDLVQGRVRPERDPAPFDRTVWVSSPGGLFETANLLVRRHLFAALGGFPPGLRPGGGKEMGEDVLFGWAARRCARAVAAGGAGRASGAG